MRKETGESELEIETETASAVGRDEDEEGRPPNDGSDHYSRGCMHSAKKNDTYTYSFLGVVYSLVIIQKSIVSRLYAFNFGNKACWSISSAIGA